MPVPISDSLLWRETADLPRVVDRVVSAFQHPSEQLTSSIDVLRGARRIVATGNGAAYYAALSMESASRVLGAPLVAVVPAGVIAAGDFAWREGDVTVVVSASGELRDIVLAIRDDLLPRPWVAITMTPESTIGAAADARVDVSVLSQDAITHTQAYVANVLSGILTVAAVGQVSLTGQFDTKSLAQRLRTEIIGALGWAGGIVSGVPRDSAFRLAFASGAGHAAALETALLMKEVCGRYVEGLETREAATTGMYALRPGDIALSHARADDPLAAETETVLSGAGARVIRLPLVSQCSALELPILGFPAAVALAGTLGVRDGRDVDGPDWAASYYQTARVH